MAWNTVGSIRGPQGDQGPKGDKGDTGPAGQGITISGSVATYANLPSGLGPSDAGKAWEVTADGKLYVWTGTQFPADGQGTNFRGPQGNAGPANTLTVGTVVSGPSPSATITGTAPNQTLNLTLQKGDTGNTGPANTLGIGTVGSGASPAASITGTAPNQTLNLTLPKGDKGDTGNAGPANSLAIGSVTAGGTPSASITGTAPNQTLNLVLVKGDTGNTGTTGNTGATGQRGSKWFTGSGAPGTISGSLAGDMYLDGDTGQVYQLV